MVTPRFFTQPNDAARELFYFVLENGDDFPEDIRSKILEHLEPGRSVSFAVSEAAEMIYARQKDLPKKVIQLGAELAIHAAHNRVNNFGDDDGKRGRALAEALRRASGEKTPPGMSWQSKDEDPMPKEVYLPPVGDKLSDKSAPEAPSPEPGTGAHSGEARRK